MLRSRMLTAVHTIAFSPRTLTHKKRASGNLALTARAIASSESGDTKPENRTDGDITDTLWTAKEGTSPLRHLGELNRPDVVQFQEVVIRQNGSPKLFHVNFGDP